MLLCSLQAAGGASHGSAHVDVSCSEASSVNPRPGVKSMVTGMGHSVAMADSTGHRAPPHWNSGGILCPVWSCFLSADTYGLVPCHGC